MINSDYPRDKMLELLDLKEEIQNMPLDEFLDMKFDEKLKEYSYW